MSTDLLDRARSQELAQRQRWRLRVRRPSSTAIAALILLAPAIISLAVFRLWPVANAVWTSMRGLTVDEFVGVDNYVRLLQDPSFLGALKTTLVFGLIVNPFQIALSLALALLLHRKLPGAGLWRTLVFLPVAVPQSVSAIIWGVAYRPDGPLNGFLERLGLPAQPFLTSSGQALTAIIILVSWIGVGYWMIFLLAGLQDIPATLYEAGKLDGAGPWQTFRSITLPQLRRPLLFVLVADTVSNMLIFAPIQILTKGGPEGSTRLIMYDIYERAYEINDLPGASAATLMLLVVVISIVAVQFRLLSGRD